MNKAEQNLDPKAEAAVNAMWKVVSQLCGGVLSMGIKDLVKKYVGYGPPALVSADLLYSYLYLRWYVETGHQALRSGNVPQIHGALLGLGIPADVAAPMAIRARDYLADNNLIEHDTLKPNVRDVILSRFKIAA